MSNNPNCNKINDKFLLMQSEVLETQTKLMQKRQNAQQECDKQESILKSQLNNLGQNLKIQQTALAKATESVNEADEQSRLEFKAYKKLDKQYRKGMRECKTNIEMHESEECSLTKLRLEVFAADYVVDCAVGSWDAKPCNKKCGSGVQRLVRKVTAHPVGGGAACPALKMERSCNDQPCPIDCEVGPWEQWTTCSANCDGGVRSRSRPIEIASAHGGQPCGETTEAEQCNAQACNQPCTLGGWEFWSPCSQRCDGGFRYRQRPVAVGATGSGKCWDEEDPERLEFETCNSQRCPKPETKTYKCDAQLDVILLLDGSGSLGRQGWEATKRAGSIISNALVGGDTSVKLAVQLFSGPGTTRALMDCLGYTDTTPDMETECNVKWVQRLSTDTAGAAEKIENLDWPGRTTLTSAALEMAQAELKFSRQGVPAVVIVVTDGVPMSDGATRAAAKGLRKKARLMFVPVGPGAPLDGIHEWASEPIHDNVIEIEDFETLERASTIDKIIMSMCPTAK